MKTRGRLWHAALLTLGVLAAKTVLAAITVGTPTITPWRDNATSAYSIVHDDVCDFNTPGINANWTEVLPRGLKLAWAAIGGQCPQTVGSIAMLNAMVVAGQEVASHSMNHCNHSLGTCAASAEMSESKTYLESVLPAGTPVSFYAFPFDSYNNALLAQLQGFGYLGARGGVRPGVGGHPVNTAAINPVADSLVDFKILYDVYETDDSGANASTYVGPYGAPTFTSLTAYLNDVVSLGGWGVQELHGIGDASFGHISLATYRLHLDDLVTRQNNREVWVAPPTEVIRYRRSRYHCGPITKSGAVLSFAGAADAGCVAYATTVTVKIPVTSGETAITAKQGTGPDETWLAVRADGAGNFFVDANPVAGPITLVDPATDLIPPTIAITSKPAITLANQASYAVEGTCSENGRTVTVLIGGVTATRTCGSPTSGHFVTTGVSVAGLDDGPVALQASISDAAGNPATVSDSTTKDTVAPPLTLGAHAAVTNANRTAYGFVGTCETGGAPVSYTLSSGGSIGGAVACASGAYAVTGLDVTSLDDSATVAFTLTQADDVGNTATVNGSAVKDTIDPSLAIDAPQPISGENQDSYTVAGDCSEAGRSVTVTLGPVSGVGPLTATAVCGALAPSRFQTAGIPVPRAMPEGSVPVSASMADALGNSATVGATAIKDTTPGVILVSDFNPAPIGETVTLTATLSDYSQVHLPTGTVAFKASGTPIPGCEAQPINPAGIYALCFLPATAGGTYPITAEYSGDAGYNPAASPVFSQLVGATAPLRVVGRFLQDAHGNNIMMRGVNLPVYKSGYDDDLDAVAAAIALTKTNAVRLEWWAVPDASTTEYTTANFDRAIQKFFDLGIIPIVELHDLTFQYGHDGPNSDGNSQAIFASTITAFWTRPDILAILVKHQDHLVINLANEWGSSFYSDATPTTVNFIQNYTNAITAMRNAGVVAPLMIDAPKGFEYQFLLDHGTALLAADPQHNTLLSTHAYWAASDPAFTPAAVNAILDAFMNSGLPVVLGEASSNAYTVIPCDLINYANLLTRANSNSTSYLFWAWYEDGQCGQLMNITVGADGVTRPTAANPGFGYDALYHPAFGIDAALPATGKADFSPVAPAPPAVTTGAASDISMSGATLNGTVNPKSLSTSAYYQYGLTTGYGSTSTASSIPSGGAGVSVPIGVTGLACNTLYHFRATATNSAGTTNGGDLTFTTAACPLPPTAVTTAATSTTQTGATLNGTVNPNGAATNRRFEYGLTSPAYGSTTQDLAIGDQGLPVTVSFVVTGLGCNTPYHYRVVGQNDGGISNGGDLTFTTAACPAAGSGNTSAVAARSIAMNSTAGDTLDTVRTEIWYKVQLYANRSYQFSAWTVGEDGAPGVTPISVDLFSDAAGTVSATPSPTVMSADLEGSPNSVAMFAQTSTFLPTSSGTYRIRVLGAPAVASTAVNLMLRETTLFSPWFFVTTSSQYDGFHEIHNNTSQPVQVTLRAFGPTGVQVGVTHTFTLPANATVAKSSKADLMVTGNGVSGGTVLTHNGAFGAISANTTTLSGLTGLSFDSPFTSRSPANFGRPIR